MFTYPLGGGVCRGHLQYPIFAPGSSKVAVGFFDLFVCSGSRICPNRACMWLLLVSYSFFVFCCWRRGVSGASIAALQKRVPGPILSRLFCGLLPIPTFFTSNGSLNCCVPFYMETPIRAMFFFFFFYPQNLEECLLQKEKKKHQGFVKHVNGG